MNKTDATETTETTQAGNEAEFLSLLAQVQPHERADVLSGLEAVLKEHQGTTTA